MSTCIYTKLNGLTDVLDLNYDLFICSSSFEDRCLQIPIALQHYSFQKTFICHFSNNYELANKNLYRLRKILNTASVLEIKKNSPIYNLDTIVTLLFTYKNSIKKKKIQVLIDISTFTHEILLLIIYLITQYLSKDNFTVKLVYNSAIDYSINEKDEEKWLSKGVGEIRTVLGYSGEMMPFKKNMLIILVGFESERVKSIIEIFEPSKVVLGYASKEGAISGILQKKNAAILENIKNTLTIDTAQFEFSCKTPSETESFINEIINQYTSEYNIIISALNNKVSTIGCALAAIKNPQVQLCYAPALVYNVEGYSTPSDNAFILEL